MSIFLTLKNYREAAAWAENQALELARRTARDRGAENAEITVSTHRLEADVAPAYQVLVIPAPGTGADGGGAGGAVTVRKRSGKKSQQLYLETTVTARGAGKVKWA